MLGLYVLGFVAAFGTARVLKSSMLKSERAPFVLEMPAYRRPTLRSLGLRLVDRPKIFLRRAGTVILTVSIVLWIAAHLPLVDGKVPPHRPEPGGNHRAHRGAVDPAARFRLEDRRRTDHARSPRAK